MADLPGMTDWDRLKGMLDKRETERTGPKIDETAMIAHLRSRVKGQDAIVEDVTRLIRLQMAKQQKSRPRGCKSLSVNCSASAKPNPLAGAAARRRA